MDDKMRALLHGMGSLLDLSPDPRRYDRVLRYRTGAARMAAHWNNVGNAIAKAVGQFEQQCQPPTPFQRPSNAHDLPVGQKWGRGN